MERALYYNASYFALIYRKTGSGEKRRRNHPVRDKIIILIINLINLTGEIMNN